MKNLFTLLLCLTALGLRAAVPTFNDFNPNQFASNVFKVTVKSGALVTNGVFTGNTRIGDGGQSTNLILRGIPSFVDPSGNDVSVSISSGRISFDSFTQPFDVPFVLATTGVVSHFFVGSGQYLTDLPSNSGILTLNGLGTNTTFKGTTTNIAGTANGTGGTYSIYNSTWHSNSTYAAPWNFEQHWSYQTTFDHDHPDVITSHGYNILDGVGHNPNEPGLYTTFESRWQNLNGFEQPEWYMTYVNPTNGYGTNYTFRYISFVPVYRIGANNQTYVDSSLAIETEAFYVRPPNYTAFAPFSVTTTRNANDATILLAGQLVTSTNQANNGGVSLLGGTIGWRVPTGVTASTVSAGIDWNNGEAVSPDFYFSSIGTSKAWTTTGFTNINFTRTGVVATNGYSSDATVYTRMPTNTPTDGFVLTAAGTAGYTKWAAGGSGSGDTNAISYPNGVNFARTRTTSTDLPVGELRYTNGNPALVITNSGSDTDGFAIKSSTGMDAFRFEASGDMRIASPNAMYLYYNDSVLWADLQNNLHRLRDTNGNTIIDFSSVDAGVSITTLNATTANTSAINLGENSGAIALDAALSADGKSSGITRAGTAGATLAFGDLIVLDPTDSRWELADANSASGADGDARGMIGICVLAAAADGDPTVILLQGVVRADAAFPSFTVNAPIYVSETAGDITATSPTTEDNVVRILGVATTADEIYFDPDRVWTVYDVP